MVAIITVIEKGTDFIYYVNFIRRWGILIYFLNPADFFSILQYCQEVFLFPNVYIPNVYMAR